METNTARPILQVANNTLQAHHLQHHTLVLFADITEPPIELIRIPIRDVPHQFASKMHVAIIGAGAAGLASARYVTDPKFAFTCEVFEQTNALGGTWVYTDSTGVDEYGLPVHTSMYHGLVTNLPKEIMDFPDFKFPDYEKSYLTQEEVLQYLQSYAKFHKIEQHIKYHHHVKQVHPVANNKWSVTVTDLSTKVDITKEFDAVMVCNGHYAKPIMAKIAGQEQFTGQQIHSHDYRKSDPFRNQRVLVVGAGPSGIDIAFRLIDYASKIILCYKKMRISIPFPQSVTLKPRTVKIENNRAVFMDNSSEEIDAIIYCTGYEYDFPFLSKECEIKVENNFVQPLYKHLINIERPTMAIIGIPFTVLPFPMFDFQARFFLKHLKGNITLPSKEDMKLDTSRDMEARKARGFPIKHAHKLGPEFQGPYFTDLAHVAQIEPLLPVKLNIYADATTKPDRKNVYKIIDTEHFTKTLLT
ncbi:Flavin-containing monooxygenase 2 [Carabus blaptoides fortunei]